MKPTTITAAGGFMLGLALTNPHPVLCAFGCAIGALVLGLGLRHRDAARVIRDAVLQDAHRSAVALSDYEGAEALAAEIERRRQHFEEQRNR